MSHVYTKRNGGGGAKTLLKGAEAVFNRWCGAIVRARMTLAGWISWFGDYLERSSGYFAWSHIL